MILKESELKSIIDEEIQAMVEAGEIDEGFLDRLKARGAGALSKVGSTARSAKQSLGSKVTGAKAAAVSALGGDSGKLTDKQRQQAMDAADTKMAGDKRSAETKIKSILSAHFKRLNTDIRKLGLGDDRKVQVALASLESAIELAAAGAAAEE